MNNNIKELIEHFIDINEENEHLTKKFTNENFVKSILDIFKNSFKNTITIDVNIPYSDIKKDEYYQYLMINIAGLLIELYIVEFDRFGFMRLNKQCKQLLKDNILYGKNKIKINI